MVVSPLEFPRSGTLSILSSGFGGLSSFGFSDFLAGSGFSVLWVTSDGLGGGCGGSGIGVAGIVGGILFEGFLVISGIIGSLGGNCRGVSGAIDGFI